MKKARANGLSCYGLKAESRFDLIYVIEFFPSKEFNLAAYFRTVRCCKVFGNDFILATHVAVSSGFLVNRIAQFEALLNKVRTHVEDFTDFSCHFSIADVNFRSTVSIDV